MKALRGEFTRLFVGPLPPLAPPWASYYLEPDRLLFQETTLWVRKRYQAYGFIAGERVNAEADDHIGLEFDFLYQLSKKTIETLQPNDSPETLCRLLEDQHSFLTCHLIRFAALFQQRVSEFAALPYYRGIALIAKGFVEEERDILKETLNSITGGKEVSNG